MNERLNWMFPSFELPRIRGVQVRISLHFFLLAIILAVRLGLSLGSIVAVAVLLAVLLHELGHVILARLTGGSASEIHVTPIGGLAHVHPGRGFWAHLVTTAAGPFVNLTICMAVFPSYYAPEALWGIVNPVIFPVIQLQEDRLVADTGLILFWVNWVLLLLNLLPTLPLDGGRIVRILLTTRIHPELVDRRALQISMAAGAILAFVGLVGDWSCIVFVGGFLFTYNLVQLFEEETNDKDEDLFLGYDFSEGYTSLDRSAPKQAIASAESHRGMLDRWRERRRLQREQALRRQQEEAERQLDELLAKVHEQGMNSLTRREQRLLRQVSELLRERGKRPS